MIPAGTPLPIRLAVAAACGLLAWWRFGRGGEGRERRPGLVWAAGFSAGAVVLGGEGAAWLLGRGAAAWLPAWGVGVLGLLPIIRGRWRGEPVTGRRRAWLAGAAGLLLVGPPLALLDGLRRSRWQVEEALYNLTGGAVPSWAVMEAALFSVPVAAVAVCVAAAAWPRAGSDGQEAEGGADS